MDEKTDQLKVHINKLDKQLHGYKVGIVIFGLAISIFLYFQWTQIPKKVEEAINAELTHEVRTKISEAAKEADSILSAKSKVPYFGTTGAGTTNWTVYDSKTVKVEVDTSSFNFKEAPLYVVSLAGKQDHYTALGTASIYDPTKDSFVVYVQQEGVTPENANDREWRVNWVAFKKQ